METMKDGLRGGGRVALALAALAAVVNAQATEQLYLSPPVGTATQRFGYAQARHGRGVRVPLRRDDADLEPGAEAHGERLDVRVLLQELVH